jgi:hypothetical protein
LRKKRQRKLARFHNKEAESAMSRAIVLVVTLVGILVIPLALKKCVAPKTPVPATVPATVVPSVAASTEQGAKAIRYGLTFSMAPLDDQDPKDVASLTCDVTGDQTLERPYKDACNPSVGDTSCRMVLPVLCIKPGGYARPAPLSGSGWSRGELAASQAVMGATLDSEVRATAMCEREFGAGWRMATFADGGNYMDDTNYDHQARGDEWGLQGKLGGGLGGTGRYWVHSPGQSANCWD